MNSFTATVATRPRASLPASVPPAMSTCAMIQPPKMSPFWLASAGIGTTRSAGCLPSGSFSSAALTRAISASFRLIVYELDRLVARDRADPVPLGLLQHHIALHLGYVPGDVAQAPARVGRKRGAGAEHLDAHGVKRAGRHRDGVLADVGDAQLPAL